MLIHSWPVACIKILRERPYNQQFLKRLYEHVTGINVAVPIIINALANAYCYVKNSAPLFKPVTGIVCFGCCFSFYPSSEAWLFIQLLVHSSCCHFSGILVHAGPFRVSHGSFGFVTVGSFCSPGRSRIRGAGGSCHPVQDYDYYGEAGGERTLSIRFSF